MFTIGADPEVFLATNNSPVSSIGLIGGTKYEPIHIQDGIFLQEDNVTVEYNIPPCKSADDFLKYNLQALHIISEKAKALNLEVSIKAAHKMPKEQLQDPRAWIFGCEPDFNVWTMEENPKPRANQWRAAGGHVHIGFYGNNMEKVELTKYLDSTLGAFFALVDPDEQRKKMYGAAGSIRFKPYGIEYRTLSNYWLTHPVLIKVVYSVVEVAIRMLANGQLPQPDVPNKILVAINKRKTKDLINYLKPLGRVGTTQLFRTCVLSALASIEEDPATKKIDINQKKFVYFLENPKDVVLSRLAGSLF